MVVHPPRQETGPEHERRIPDALSRGRPYESMSRAEQERYVRENRINASQKSLFRRILIDPAKAVARAGVTTVKTGANLVGKTVNVVTYPLRATGKFLWRHKFKILIGTAVAAIFAAGPLLKLFGAAEGASMGPGMDWLQRWLKTMRSVTPGFTPPTAPIGFGYGTPPV